MKSRVPHVTYSYPVTSCLSFDFISGRESQPSLTQRWVPGGSRYCLAGSQSHQNGGHFQRPVTFSPKHVAWPQRTKKLLEILRDELKSYLFAFTFHQMSHLGCTRACVCTQVCVCTLGGRMLTHSK